MTLKPNKFGVGVVVVVASKRRSTPGTKCLVVPLVELG